MGIPLRHFERGKEIIDDTTHQELYDACIKLSEHILKEEGHPDIRVCVKNVTATHAYSHESGKALVQYGKLMLMNSWKEYNGSRANFEGPKNYIWWQKYDELGWKCFTVKGWCAGRCGLTKEERVASVIIEEVAHTLCESKVNHGWVWKDKCRDLFKKYITIIINDLRSVTIEDHK